MTHSLWFINHDWTRKRPIQVSSTHVDFWEFSKLEIKKSVLWRKLPRSHQNESSLWLIKYVSYALNHLQDSVICIFSLLQLYTTIFKIFDIFRIFENFSKNVRSEFLLGSSKQDLRFTNKAIIYKKKGVSESVPSWVFARWSPHSGIQAEERLKVADRARDLKFNGNFGGLNFFKRYMSERYSFRFEQSRWEQWKVHWSV